MCSALVSAHALKNEVFRDVVFEMQTPMVNQSTDYFSICTNGTHSLQVLMRCSLH